MPVSSMASSYEEDVSGHPHPTRKPPNMAEALQKLFYALQTSEGRCVCLYVYIR
jgi:hypothetical protein